MKNGIYNSVGGIVRLAVALALVPLLIRIIGTTEYGVCSLAFAIVGVSAVTETGLSSSVTVFASRDLAESNRKALSQTLTISLAASILLAAIVGGVLWFGAETITSWFPKIPTDDQPLVTKALRIGSILILARLPQQVLIGVQQAFQRFGILNAVLTIQSLTLGIGMVAVAANGGTTIQFMIVQTTVTAATLLAHAVVTYRLLHEEHMRLNWSNRKVGEMLHFGALSTISNIGGVLFTQCDRLVVGAFLDTATLGIYAAITTITTQINTVSSLPVQPLLARVSHLSSKTKISANAKHEIQHTVQFNAVLAFGTAGGIFILAPLIARVIFHGNTDATIVTALRCAAIIYSVYSLNAPGYFILPAIGALAQHTMIQVVGGALSLLLIWIGATHWGLLGGVCGNVGFVTTLLLTALALTRLRIPISESLRWMLFPIIWMVATIVLALILPPTVAFECCLLVIACGVLCWWAVRLAATALMAAK